MHSSAWSYVLMILPDVFLISWRFHFQNLCLTNFCSSSLLIFTSIDFLKIILQMSNFSVFTKLIIWALNWFPYFAHLLMIILNLCLVIDSFKYCNYFWHFSFLKVFGFHWSVVIGLRRAMVCCCLLFFVFIVVLHECADINLSSNFNFSFFPLC